MAHAVRHHPTVDLVAIVKAESFFATLELTTAPATGQYPRWSSRLLRCRRRSGRPVEGDNVVCATHKQQAVRDGWCGEVVRRRLHRDRGDDGAVGDIWKWRRLPRRARQRRQLRPAG
jgi:hypothetical protein